MLKNTNKLHELQDLLDSDDELPMNYKEEPELPAYLDDGRFDAIKFSWIKNNKVRRIPVKPAVTPAPTKTVSGPHEWGSLLTEDQGSKRNLIKKGILNEQDILCMKSVAALTTNDSDLLWFIDFLMYKDLQADYRFLKSCLVIAQESYGSSRKLYSHIVFPQTFTNCFKLVVK